MSRTILYKFRLEPEEIKSYREHAGDAGMPVAGWLRQAARVIMARPELLVTGVLPRPASGREAHESRNKMEKVHLKQPLSRPAPAPAPGAPIPAGDKPPATPSEQPWFEMKESRHLKQFIDARGRHPETIADWEYFLRKG